MPWLLAGAEWLLLEQQRNTMAMATNGTLTRNTSSRALVKAPRTTLDWLGEVLDGLDVVGVHLRAFAALGEMLRPWPAVGQAGEPAGQHGPEQRRPIEPPICRKKVMELVAEPMSRRSTEFCRR